MMETKWSRVSQQRNKVCLWKWLPSLGNAYLCQKYSLHIYAKDSIEKMKGFILFENQGINNPSNEPYSEKDYSPPHEFSYH